jgi:hypothetical protein
MSTLTLLEAYLSNDVQTGDLMAVIGDFNCDLNRSNSFDLILNNFISENNLVDSLSLFEQENIFTYHKGNYRSTIDHILCNSELASRITSSKVIVDSCHASDHHPVCVQIGLNENPGLQETEKSNKNKFHFFDWKNFNFREAYCNLLRLKLIELSNALIVGNVPTAEQIDGVCDSLYPLMVKAAREAEKFSSSPALTAKKVRRQLGNLITENKEARETYFKIEHYQKVYKLSGYTDEIAKIYLKFHRKNLREMGKFFLEEKNKKKSFVLDYLINEKNNIFWKRISNFKNSSARKNLVI